MGHSEMLLAVAGLDQATLDDRVRRLAGGDWSGFTPGEQAAFAFARKHSLEPWRTSPADFRDLERHWGTAAALDIVYYSASRHYMMRVADAFQLPLERDNVFRPPAPVRPAPDGPVPPAKPRPGA